MQIKNLFYSDKTQKRQRKKSSLPRIGNLDDS